MMNRKVNDKSHQVQAYTIKDDIEEFKHQSPGIFTYFYFLKFFGIVFFIISLISIYPIILNSVGNYLTIYGKTNFVIETSMGNIKGVTLSDDEITAYETMDD